MAPGELSGDSRESPDSLSHRRENVMDPQNIAFSLGHIMVDGSAFSLFSLAQLHLLGFQHLLLPKSLLLHYGTLHPCGCPYSSTTTHCHYSSSLKRVCIGPRLTGYSREPATGHLFPCRIPAYLNSSSMVGGGGSVQMDVI